MADDPVTIDVPGGRRLGDYELIRRVGAGAYADVWLAKDAVGKFVAVKVIDRERLRLISRRNREEEALGLLRTKLPEHAHLIRVHHVGAAGPHFYYVMDLADDVTPSPHASSPYGSPLQRGVNVESYRPLTLDEHVRARGRLPVGEAIDITKDILSAVACLHDGGFLHRDIKPTNVIRVGGQWKLADIGLLTADTTEVTAVGTPDFMPPSGQIDRTADLYALGKLLYCLVSGNSPRSFPQIPKAVLGDENSRAEIAEVNSVVVQACASAAGDRFAFAEAFGEALDECVARIESGSTAKRRMSGRRLFVMAGIVAVIVAAVMLVEGSVTETTDSGVPQPEARWVSLFNGKDLSGWYRDKPNHGQWRVEDGVITMERNDEYKSLLTNELYGPGTIRATVFPGHEGARIGIGYLCPEGPLFMLMGEKYTWLYGYCKDCPLDIPDRWRSFPGPIPRVGESVMMEVEYGPDRVVLRVNGIVLQELPGRSGEGHIALHVWKDDAGGYKNIEYRPAEEQ